MQRTLTEMEREGGRESAERRDCSGEMGVKVDGGRESAGRRDCSGEMRGKVEGGREHACSLPEQGE